MRVLNDFYCPRCTTTKEYFVDNLMTTVDCLYCQTEATRVQHATHFNLPGNDLAGFPTAHARWEKRREQKIAQEIKADISLNGPE
jgi:hypothetical protein